ncbi:MAG: iron-sulfur cluster assembly accessory protein [Nitrospirota bacterium]
MQITITERAGTFIRRMIAFGGGEPGSGFRLAVKPGGCAGLSYDFNIEATPQPGDEVVEGPGFKVHVPVESRPYLEGTTVDFVETLMQSGLTFTNPNAGAQCGCGSSFSPTGEAPSVGKECGKP